MSWYLRILGAYAIVGLLMVFAVWRLGMRPRLVLMVFSIVMLMGVLHCLAVMHSPDHQHARPPENGEKNDRHD